MERTTVTITSVKKVERENAKTGEKFESVYVTTDDGQLFSCIMANVPNLDQCLKVGNQVEIGFTVNDKGYNVLRNIRMATASHEESQQEITIEKVYAKLLSIEKMLNALKG